MTSDFPRARFVVLALVLLGGACRSGGDDDAINVENDKTPSELSAQIASYDLVANQPSRFLVGLQLGTDLVGFGEVELTFRPFDEARAPANRPPMRAEYRLIPGQDVPLEGETRKIEDGKGIGVYVADGVSFDKPGSWSVKIALTLDGKQETVSTPFQVLPESAIPAVGEMAPRTVNHLPGAPDVPPKAVDSRAEDGKPLPDPELHAMTVADAIASGQPVMVVISTPVYCQSRFCGPITDAVQVVAAKYGDRMKFVHLEVWRDFEGKAINKAAAEWIYPTKDSPAQEPWTFVIGRDGKITHRFDNVASDAELDAAARLVSG